MNEVLKYDVGFVLKKSAVNVKTMQAEGNMQALNYHNWQSLVYHFTLQQSPHGATYQILVKALPDYEGMVIGFEFLAIGKDSKQ